jgi:hypothetical protein
MSDLLALSCTQKGWPQAQQLFRQACASIQSTKRLKLNDQAEADGFLIARFASALSPVPNIVHLPEKGLMISAAGWCQLAGTRRTGKPVLEVLADEYLEHLSDKNFVFSCLQGQYAAACIDVNHRRMLGWVDRLGLMPAYVYSAEGIAWFSTSAMALACVVKPQLDLHSVRMLFTGNSPKSPHSLFEGIVRLGFGQHVELFEGRYRVESTWTPYRPAVRYRNLNDAVDEGVSRLRACCEGLRRAYAKPIMDFTSGLDSRLLVAGMGDGGGRKPCITVTGAPGHIDVEIAHRAAKQFGWDILLFTRPENWGARRWPFFQQGVALSEGELTGNRIDHTLRIKQAVGDAGGVAVTGGGGELYREFFWQQEFFRIGRTSELNLPKLIKYRFDLETKGDNLLFGKDWHRHLIAEELANIKRIVDLAPNSLNTAKLDAIYIWKSGGHVGRYGAAAMPVVPSLSPLATQELIEYAVSVPWQYRMHGRLIRGMITRLNPKLAKLPTWYGSSAEPLSAIRPLQLLKHGTTSARKLIRKIGQVTIGHGIPEVTAVRHSSIPDFELKDVLHDEGMLNAENLVTAGLYDPKGLVDFLNGAVQHDFTHHQQLQVLVSVELICRICGLTTMNGRI